MAGTAAVRQSRKRAKAAVGDAAAPPPPSRAAGAVAAATNLPLLSFNLGSKETTPTRTVASSRAQALKEKEKAAAATAAFPPAKKNLQTIFEATSGETRKGFEFSFMYKVLLLLIAVAGFSSTLLSMRDGAQSPMPEMPTAGKISEVEDFMRKTSKWLQVQLDVVDERIGKEVLGVRSELEEKMMDKTRNFEAEMRIIKAQAESADNSLKTLYSEEVLSKEETLQLINTAMDKRAREGSDNAISLDDVRAAARKVVQRELEIHAADGIGRVDYALESGGGKVVHHSDGYFQGLHWSKLGFYVLPGAFRRHPMADMVIRPSFGEPGQCLPLKGSNGTVDVRLRSRILPEAITLEHLSKKVAYDARSAPKDFEIFGWLAPKNNVHTANLTSLGKFTYDLDKGNSIQTFELSDNPKSPINMVRLHILSNYGSSTHTCLYRLRVHGTEVGVSV